MHETQNYALQTENFHIRTVHLDIIKVLFIRQMMHKWVVLKKNTEIYIRERIIALPDDGVIPKHEGAVLM